MRVAILSDIHANLHALQAVAKDLEQAHVEETWCLGDVVGYGAFPHECLEWAEKHTQILIKGNHDQAIATGAVGGFNPAAASAARYHAQVLSPAERARLHDLPEEARRRLATPGSRPDASALLVHASPDDPLREYVHPSNASRDLHRWRGVADLVMMGHTHVPFVAQLHLPDDAQWSVEGFATHIKLETEAAPGVVLLNPGSVGQPRDDDPRASYAVLDHHQRTIELRRVAYDIDAAATAIRTSGLDAFLAQRLYRGV